MNMIVAYIVGTDIKIFIFVEAHRLSLGYQAKENYKKMAFVIYDENRRALLVEHF